MKSRVRRHGLPGPHIRQPVAGREQRLLAAHHGHPQAGGTRLAQARFDKPGKRLFPALVPRYPAPDDGGRQQRGTYLQECSTLHATG
jgi:hypothetical protein